VQQPIRHHRRGTESHARGVVDNESDKNIANIRANGVSGVFAVTNNLQVVKN
jgi:osmotically-inducible protein OsmY